MGNKDWTVPVPMILMAVLAGGRNSSMLVIKRRTGGIRTFATEVHESFRASLKTAWIYPHVVDGEVLVEMSG